jgi:acetolactate synthase-1/2/3 large subunit
MNAHSVFWVTTTATNVGDFMNGGDIIGAVLAAQGVKQVFTLCGGHISPILVGAKQRGIRIIDVRSEANAVFAADAIGRVTSTPGVAAVTAGPGVTNTITALQNALMAQSPLVLFGGATPTVLAGRGALQDIDQMAIIKTVTKWSVKVRRLSQLGPAVERAFQMAQEGVPGPVFVECPVDLLYDEALVRSWYEKESKGRSLGARALSAYLSFHLGRQFNQASPPPVAERYAPPIPAPSNRQVERCAKLLANAERPVLVLGSQTVVAPQTADATADAIRSLGIPTFLGGMCRGLLGQDSPIQYRHKRSTALRAADLVIVAGFPFDFRLGYGKSINSSANVVAINRCPKALTQNRKPTLAVQADAGAFLRLLSTTVQTKDYADWHATIATTEEKRSTEIKHFAAQETAPINPLDLLQRLEALLPDRSTLVVDGGDFVGTASYILSPREPLSWLDPGVFGTLGVGGGFAIGAALARPNAETWLIYGDGSSAYSLAEFDTMARHDLPVIALIGTDGSWAQIAREQVEVLGDAVGTELVKNDYHTVGEGYGAVGLLLNDPAKIDMTIKAAQKFAAAGRPVVINAHIGPTDFRKGSISM